MTKYFINTDGGSRGNPGPAGAGVVVSDGAGNKLKEAYKFLGRLTNNEAEYQAVIFGLETFKRVLGKKVAQDSEIEIRLDSELVARQLAGEYQIKEKDLQPLFLKIWNWRVADFPRLVFRSIPRAKNRRADELANLAMDEISKKSLF